MSKAVCKSTLVGHAEFSKPQPEGIYLKSIPTYLLQA
jgi:hypothetical protein